MKLFDIINSCHECVIDGVDVEYFRQNNVNDPYITAFLADEFNLDIPNQDVTMENGKVIFRDDDGEYTAYFYMKVLMTQENVQ